MQEWAQNNEMDSIKVKFVDLKRSVLYFLDFNACTYLCYFIVIFFSLLESEFMPGEEFAEGGGPAAIRDLGMLLSIIIIFYY